MWNTKHIIIDDFLEKNHFDFLSKIEYGKVPEDGVTVFLNSVQDGKVLKNSGKIPEGLLLELDRTYTPRLLESLKELAPRKVAQVKHAEISIIVTGKNSRWHIHTDVPTKLLSGVVYLSPEKNTGTRLYNSKTNSFKGTDRTEVEWKQNRAFLFSRNPNSWHNYKSNGISDRMVLVYNLRKDDAVLNLQANSSGMYERP